MLFLWSELSERYDCVFPHIIIIYSLNKVFCITWRVYSFYWVIIFLPKFIHMSSCPRGVCSYLISWISAPLIKFNQKFIISHFRFFHRWRSFVVKLYFITFNIFNHISAHGWVMSVWIYFDTRPKYFLDEGVTESNSHCINKDITRLQTYRMNWNVYKCYCLEDNSHHRIVAWV